MVSPHFSILTFLLLLFKSFSSTVLAVPHDASGVYEINPPASDLVYFTVEYYDIDTKSRQEEEIIIELYGTVAPNTTHNFKGLSDGVKALLPNVVDKTKAITVGYHDTVFHRIISNFMIQGGNVLPDIGPFSLFGYKFDDENFWLQHDRPGRVSMANSGPNTNACQFFITTKALPDLDGKHVVFGQVIQGLDVLLDKIQYLETETDEEKAANAEKETNGMDKLDKHMKRVNIKYSSTLGRRLQHRDDLHKTYVDKVTKFRKGEKDESNSMTFNPYVHGSVVTTHADRHATHKTDKPVKYGGDAIAGSGNGGNNQFSLMEILVLLGKISFIGLLIFLFNVFLKKNYKRNSNKVVGLRHD